MSDQPLEIPAAFWTSLSEREIMDLLTNNGNLNRGQCVRLWEMLGRADHPPESVQLMFRKDDIVRLFPGKPKGKRR